MYHVLLCLFVLVASTSAISCLKRLFSEMSCYVSLTLLAFTVDEVFSGTHLTDQLRCVSSHSDILTLILSGAILIMELQGENAVDRWQQLLGPPDAARARDCSPSSIRARFGTGQFAASCINLSSHESTVLHVH